MPVILVWAIVAILTTVGALVSIVVAVAVADSLIREVRGELDPPQSPWARDWRV